MVAIDAGGHRVNILGLDPSLTSPGFACEDEAWSFKVGHVQGPARLDLIRIEVLRVIEQYAIDLAVIEGYSMGSRSSSVTGLAELGGVLRLSLHRRKIPFVDVAPTTLKKFATGKGNSDKDAVLVAAVRKSQLDLPGNDAADAWWLRQAGLHWYGEKGAVKLPADRRGFLKVVTWPTFDNQASA